MTSLGAFFKAERVKWRKSWLLLTAILGPLCQTGFLAVIFWFSESRIRMFKPGFQFWLELNFVAWNLVVMPVIVALVSELSWEQEREARTWNLLLIQPVPRRTHYLVKTLSHLALLLLSLALFALLLLLGGLLLRDQPGLLMGPLPLATFARFAGYSALALVAIVAFQTWLSMRIPGLWIGLAAALAGSWFTQRLVGGSALVQLLPWGLAAHMAIMFERWRALPWAYAVGSLLSAGAMVALGALDFTRHHEPRA
ncbi:ABC transporter permease [Geothrix campi]|uniref:ABC transporter permease n=1 Tax=Geothrix campi TaxID=2966450 RepID=UPI002147DD8F|nr:ABC transporter permease [Geothrix sp. SG10]